MCRAAISLVVIVVLGLAPLSVRGQAGSAGGSGSGAGGGISGHGGAPGASRAGLGGPLGHAGVAENADDSGVGLIGASRPPLGSPNVGNIGAPSSIVASQDAPPTLGAAGTAAPQAEDRSPTLSGTNVPRAGTNPNGVLNPNFSAPPSRAIGALGRDWRYVYQNGWHWYWMPNNSWSVWNGTSWTPYARSVPNGEAQAHMQMRGYRQAPPATYRRAYADSERRTVGGANDMVTRDGTLPLGPRRYSAAVGPEQGLPPQATAPLPKSSVQQSGQDVLEEVPDASGVTVP